MRAALAGTLLMAVFGLAACTPRVMAPGPAVVAPVLGADAFTASDGARLPVRSWSPDVPARAVLVVLHGFNDYSNFFAAPGPWFADHAIAVYAYDQRGFGEAPHPGLWAGDDAMVADLKAVTGAVRARHPDVPVYILGESMGGAVAMAGAVSSDPPGVAGYILSGPAVWGRATMPLYQRAALWLGAHTVPWLRVTGRGLDIWPSDNVEMLRALGADPLVIKETRIDAVWGLTNLMDRALAAAGPLDRRVLVLYGERDEVIPPKAFKRMAATFKPSPVHSRTVALYRDGWHMLLRDKQAAVVWADIAAWMTGSRGALPSGAEKRAAACLGETPPENCFPKRVGSPLDD